MSTTYPLVSGEIWHKWQRALRTALTTILTILPLIPQVIEIVQGQWDVKWLTAVGVQAVAINTALSRIIAIPLVDSWLKRIGFGSAPRSAIELNKLKTLPPGELARYLARDADGRIVTTATTQAAVDTAARTREYVANTIADDDRITRAAQAALDKAIGNGHDEPHGRTA